MASLTSININETIAVAALLDLNPKKRKFEEDEKENGLPGAKKCKISTPVNNSLEIALQTLSNKKTSDNLLKTLSTSPHALKLWNQAKVVAPNLSVRFVPKVQQSDMGICNYRDQEITIRKDACQDRQMAVLLFELCNLLLMNAFAKIEALASAGKIKTAMEYAFCYESIEYESVRKYSEVIRGCIEEDGWSADMYEFGPTTNHFPDFETYWKIQVKHGHTQHYINDFKALVEKSEEEASSLSS